MCGSPAPDRRCSDGQMTSHLWLEPVAKLSGAAYFRLKTARSPCFSLASFMVAWPAHHSSATPAPPSFYRNIVVFGYSNHLAKDVIFPMRE